MDSLRMKTGIDLLEEGDMNEQVRQQILSILLVFLEDATETAAMYAIGQNRSVVTGADQAKALQYQARMFFQQAEGLEERTAMALRALQGGEESEEEGEESEEEAEESEEEDESEDMDDDQQEVACSDENNGIDDICEDDLQRARQIVPRVDAIVASWPLYAPEDPILKHLKKMVDHTLSTMENEGSSSDP